MTNRCINNLRLIDTAESQWALDHNKKTGAVPTVDDLLPYLKDHRMPECPDGGVYTLHPVGSEPTC
jgi:hypothetical protein